MRPPLDIKTEREYRVAIQRLGSLMKQEISKNILLSRVVRVTMREMARCELKLPWERGIKIRKEELRRMGVPFCSHCGFPAEPL